MPSKKNNYLNSTPIVHEEYLEIWRSEVKKKITQLFLITILKNSKTI